MNELVITGYDQTNICAFYENGEMTKVSSFTGERTSDIGTIYVGRVDNIVKNINAAFVAISEQCSCYLDLNTIGEPVFIKRQSKDKVCMGDQLIVQLIKESVKTKAPVVTASFSLTGKYAILIHGGTGIQISKKIVQKSVRNEWKAMVEEFSSDSYGLILRTNIQYVDPDDVIAEIKSLIIEYRNITINGAHQAKYTVLHEDLPTYLANLRDAKDNLLERIVTDLPDVFFSVEKYLQKYPMYDANGNLVVLEYMEDSKELSYLYKIKHYMDSALKRLVYLKSGATLVIDPTEAMTVIDVNTGKAISGKKAFEQTFFAINMEAAEEIAKQIKLRNISGIILIDFINMQDAEHVTQLLAKLRTLFEMDPIQTELVDVTKLGLVEITRKKVYKTIAEQLNENNFM